MINDYLSLSTLAGFNRSVEHLRAVTKIIKCMKEGKNLADIVHDMDEQQQINKVQIGPVVNSILVERSQYANCSLNMPKDFSDFDDICKTTSTWTELDIMLAFHHPQIGITLINPKNRAHWDNVQNVSSEELMVIYAKSNPSNDEKNKKAIQVLRKIFIGTIKASEAKL